MSNNLPPRRPRVPVIKGPRPVTVGKARPVAAPQAQPAPKASPEPQAPAKPAQETVSVSSGSVAATQSHGKIDATATTVAATISSTPEPETPKTEKAPSPSRKPEAPSKKNTPKTSAERDKKGSDPIKIILVLLVLMLGGVVGFLVYDKMKNEEALTTRAENAEQKSIGLQSDINIKVEEISKLQDSLRSVIAEKEALGLALADERAKIAELEQLKGQLQSKQLSINSLNKKLSTYRKDYETAQASMGALIAENQRLVSEKVRLEKVVQEKADSLEKLASVQVAMAEKVSQAGALKAENLHVIVYNTGNKEMKNPRAMMAGKIKVSLSLGDNKYTDQGPKDIYLRVIEPSGNTLYNGSKSFEADGQKVFYTEKQTVNFNNTKQRVSFMYSKGSRYAPGRYTVEVWSDSKKIGNSEFVLQK